MLGIEQKIVPEYIKDIIPDSTYKGWRNQNPDKFIGRELMSDICNHLNFTQEVANRSNTLERRVFTSYLRLKIMIIELVGKRAFQKLLHDNMTKVVNTVERAEKYLDLKKVLKFLNLKDKTFYHWRTIVKFKCDHSAIFLCTRRHPNQATKREVSKISNLLNCPELSHWPISSVWGYAIKNKLVTLSLPTWYHYNKILKIRKRYRKFKKRDEYKSITTQKINQVWHADITLYKTVKGNVYYIYTIMDNFSRKVLHWTVATRVCANIRLNSIKKALEHINLPHDTIRLVTDGGPENDNLTIKEFLNNCQVNIHHQIALRDIISSNSAIEANNKILKRFLRLFSIHTKKELLEKLAFFFEDYNDKRPHYRLGIFTPNEIYQGAMPGNPYALEYPIAAQKRRETNRNSNCKVCK